MNLSLSLFSLAFCFTFMFDATIALAQGLELHQSNARTQVKHHSDPDLVEYKRQLLGGLDVKVASRLEMAARASIVDLLLSFQEPIVQKMKLSQSEKRQFTTAIEARTKAREQCKKKWQQYLLDVKSPAEVHIHYAISELKREEAGHEADFTKQLEDMLDPLQIEVVCSFAMGKLRGHHARFPLIINFLGLTPVQVEKYERYRIANEELVSQNDKDVPEDRFAEMSKRIVQLGIEADASLTPSQFLFVGRADGFIKQEESLEEFYLRHSEKEKISVRTMLPIFSEIQAKLAKGATK